MYVRLKRSLFLLRLKKHHKKSPQNAAFETRTELSGGGLDEVLGSFEDGFYRRGWNALRPDQTEHGGPGRNSAA